MSAPAERRFVDVSELPTVPVGPANLVWWSTIGFMVIEGFTLLIVATSYLYLSRLEPIWPPPPTPLPDLPIATINLALILLLMAPMTAAGWAAKRHDRAGVARWMLISAALTVPTLVLRWFELDALNVRWDSNAYGSVAWSLPVLHGTLLALDFAETLLLGVLFLSGHAQRKHYSDAQDAVLYQYFLSIAWVPLYLLVFWGARWIP